jgi:hypothetical protein
MAGIAPPVATIPGVASGTIDSSPSICTDTPAYCSTNIPIMVGNSGTVLASATLGNLTLGTALDAIYGPTNNNCPGIWVNMPSTALAAPNNVAGVYWCVMTSTTVGTVYTAQPANAGVAQVFIAASQSGAAGAVAQVQVVSPLTPPTGTLTIATGTGSGYTAAITALPAIAFACQGGTVQPTGAISFTGVHSAFNSAGAKTLRGVVSAAALLTTPAVVASSALTTGVSAVMTAVSALWLGASNSWRFVTAGSVPTFSVLDASGTLYIGATQQVAVATDWDIMHSFQATINQF